MRIDSKPLPSDIETGLRGAAAALASDRRVLFAYVFGGAGRGRITPLSDVDVAVFLEDGTDPIEARLELLGILNHVLSTDAIDLVVLNDAPIALAGRVQLSARVIVDRARSRRLEYESLTRRQFADFLLMEARVLNRRFGRGR